MGHRNSKRRIPTGKEGWTAAEGIPEPELGKLLDADGDSEGIVAGVVEGNPSDDIRSDSDGEGDACARFDFSTETGSARGKYDDGKSKLKHNIKTAAFERLMSKMLKKHMLPKDGSELTETWYHVERCRNVPDVKKYIVHCYEHRICDTYKMKKVNRRMALVALTNDFRRPVRPTLPSTGSSGVVCANWTCEDFPHFAETVTVLVFG
eukprot:jgi/Tetstr1/433608/TSEL_022873.t1